MTTARSRIRPGFPFLLSFCLAPLLLAAPSRTSAETPSLAVLYDQLRAPRIAGTVSLPDGRFVVGHATITLRPGTRTYALAAGDELCGLLIDGEAALTYRVEDPYSVPVAERNLRRAKQLDSRREGTALVISDSIAGAAVWGWDLDLGEVDASKGGAAAPQWLLDFFAKKLIDNPERDLLLDKWNAASRYRMAAFHTTGNDLVLDVDPRPFARQETLFQVDSISAGAGDLSGKFGIEELAVQPLGRTWLEPITGELVADDTEIQLRNPEKERLEVTTSTRFTALVDGVRVLHFLLWDHTYDENLRARPNTIRRLLLDGQPAPYLHRKDSLFVELPKPTRRGQAFRLEVSTEGDVLERPGGNSYWRLGMGAWYPRPASAGGEMAEIRLTADVAPPFVPIAVGEVLERGMHDGVNRVRTKLRRPMERAIVVAGKFSTIEEAKGDARIQVSTYATVREDEARKLANIMFTVRSCFENWLGIPYPFQDLEVIEMPSWGWGQAPSGAIFITREAFMTQVRASAEQSSIAELAARGINERIAHEIAHAYFPDVAKVNRDEEDWLSESLAEYTSAYCVTESMKERDGKRHWERQLRDWKDWSKRAGNDSSVFLASHLTNSENDDDTRQYLLYGRGPLVFHAVREKLKRDRGEEAGEKLFLTWIRSYVKSFEFKLAETRHLIGILDQITGESWMPFFERHLLGTEPPKID